eukprot:6625095-Heterocapsa_arctica.AAC.1
MMSDHVPSKCQPKAASSRSPFFMCAGVPAPQRLRPAAAQSAQPHVARPASSRRTPERRARLAA